MSASRLSVMKLVGTGNDFLFIDARKDLPGSFAQVPRPEIVRRLCDRHFGLGSDGLGYSRSTLFAQIWRQRYAVVKGGSRGLFLPFL